MLPKFFRALGGAGLCALVLSGCVTMPEQQAYNREVHPIKTVAVLETTPVKTSVFMLNHPGVSFGLIGGLVAAADQSSKESKFHATLEQAGFEPLPYFRERLSLHMAERGYVLVWPESQVEKKKSNRGSFGLRKAYGTNSTGDAQLDINFGFVGYAAAGAGDGSPYRPTVTMAARLISPDGKQNYYTDYYAYNNVFNLTKAVVIDGGAEHVYPGFDELHASGVESVEGLKEAIDAVAAKIAQQI